MKAFVTELNDLIELYFSYFDDPHEHYIDCQHHNKYREYFYLHRTLLGKEPKYDLDAGLREGQNKILLRTCHILLEKSFNIIRDVSNMPK